ncbi:MAG: hypothetical protein AAFQ41_14005 [Cyanobacteria bacterium J06623_7]
MKYQLLFLSLLTTALSASLFGDRPTVAEPAPLFQPIVREIRDRLPQNFKMRLPASLPEFTEELPLYAFIPADDVQVVGIGDKDIFSVLVADEPGCASKSDPGECLVGVISVTEALSESPLQPDDLPGERDNLTAVTLAEAATGFYFTQEDEIQLIVWEQDNLGYLLFSEKCSDGCLTQAEMIEIATSAANEPAIVSAAND